MANTPPDGWWQASDGNWYRPEQHPDYRPPLPPSPRSAAAARGPKVVAATVVGVLLFVGLVAFVSARSKPDLPDGVTWRYNEAGDIEAFTLSTSPDELRTAAEAIRSEAEVEDSKWIIFDCPGGSDERTASYRWAETAKGRAQIGADSDDYIFERDSTTPCAERGPPLTGNAAGGSMALDGDVPDDAICRDLPQGCTPRPTVEQAAAIEAGVAAVYPGVPEGKATDWAIYLCSDIRSGLSGQPLVNRLIDRYSGGSRPDPTPAQADQILDVIESVAFCL